MPLEIGQLIEGKYRIVRLIGEGGMGAVYEGENVRINRRVAIKVLHAAYTGNAEVIQRFEREAQAAGRIGNDHILEVLDLGSFADGDHFIVMEFLDGEPLSGRIRDRGRLTPYELTPIIRQVLVGLGAAHQAGIVHRDLKPDNIYILKSKAGTSDFVKIIDFGISKFQPLAGDGMKMTRTGTVMGTPYYMSPEQASGSHEADQRSDLYSVGVILFEAVTGRVPFDAATFNQLMFKIVLAEVPTAESVVAGLDPAFSSIISKSMARDANHRFQSAKEFIQALDDWMARGTAVSMPANANAAVGLVPATSTAPAAAGARTPGPQARTGGNWATSQPDGASEPLPKKRSSGMLVGLSLLGLVLVGGGALAAVKVLGGSEEAKAPAAAAPVAAPAPVRADPAPQGDALAQAKPEAEVSPAPATASAVEPPVAAPSAQRPASRRPQARPAAKPASDPRPKGAAGSKSAAPATPDFGY